VLSVTLFVILFGPQIFRERLNRFAPNLQGRRVWSLARTNLNVNVKGQKSKSPGTKKRKTAQLPQLTMHGKACAVRRSLQSAADDTIPSPPKGDGVTAVHTDCGLRAAYVW